MYQCCWNLQSLIYQCCWNLQPDADKLIGLEGSESLNENEENNDGVDEPDAVSEKDTDEDEDELPFKNTAST